MPDGPVRGAPNLARRTSRVPRVPEHHSLPGARGGEQAAVRAERHRVQRLLAVHGQQRTAHRHRVTGPGHVPQPQRAIGRRHREHPVVGAEADRLHHPGRVDDPGRGRAAGRLQQAGPGVGGGRDPVGGQAQLGRQPGALPAHLVGLDGHFARLRGVLGHGRVVPRAGGRLALLEGVPGQGDGHDNEHRERRDQAAQPPGAVPLRGLLQPFLRGPRVHERPGQRAQAVPVDRVGGPVPGQGQLAAAEQRRGIPPGLVPGPGGVAEPPPDPQALPVGVDPGAQQRPGGEQGLVGDLRRVRVHGDQPFRDEPVEYLPGGRGVARPVAQLGQPHRAARLRCVVGHVHQAQEEPPGDVPLLLVQGPVDLVGGPRDRVPDAAAGLVVSHGEPASVAA